MPETTTIPASGCAAINTPMRKAATASSPSCPASTPGARAISTSRCSRPASVCGTRRGLVPAAIVARELGIRIIETVCVTSYDDTKQGPLHILKRVAADVVALDGGEGRGVLIVDDLVDTGKTARIVRDMLP